MRGRHRSAHHHPSLAAARAPAHQLRARAASDFVARLWHNAVRLLTVTPIPVWVVALALAAVAPWCARVLQLALERRAHRRTLDFVAEACGRGRDGQRHEVDEGDGPRIDRSRGLEP